MCFNEKEIKCKEKKTTSFWMKYSTKTRKNIENDSKGQLISKCLFGVFTFFQKTIKKKSTSSKVEFVRSFFGRNVGLKQSFRICLTFI